MNTIAANKTFIIAAYGVTWVVILGYLTRLILLKRRVLASRKELT